MGYFYLLLQKISVLFTYQKADFIRCELLHKKTNDSFNTEPNLLHFSFKKNVFTYQLYKQELIFQDSCSNSTTVCYVHKHTYVKIEHKDLTNYVMTELNSH